MRAYNLAKQYLDRDSENYNPSEAVKCLVESAQQGYTVAQYRLGKLHLKGEYTPNNIGEAIRLFRLASSGGNSYAEYQLGKLFLYDRNGNPRHAHKRGSGSESQFKCNRSGSIPKHSFHWHGRIDRLYLLEAPISKALGSRTVMSGSVSRSKNDPRDGSKKNQAQTPNSDTMKKAARAVFYIS